MDNTFFGPIGVSDYYVLPYPLAIGALYCMTLDGYLTAVWNLM